jgi:creatinine amidohydrolase
MENFPWTRLPGVTMPDTQRPMVDMARVRALDPVALRQYLGDGNFGGMYQRSGRRDARAVADRGGRDTRAADALGTSDANLRGGRSLERNF